MFAYRPHIDGLRAVAVWLVVLFHMYPSVFPGGYLGVDIFFVISGFVITQSLYKDHQVQGRIRIFAFYLRRFKRLYPALAVMLVCTTVAYILFGFLWDSNLYLKSALSAFFASSNLYFLFHGTNYFHQDLINPLVHTWSLGVEEQFYLLYPMLLSVGLWSLRRSGRGVGILIGIMAVLSAALFVMFARNTENVLGAFYFPIARFWEFGIGCILFFLTVSRGVEEGTSSRVAIAGMAILVGVQWFQPVIQSIPIETLVTGCASALIIWGGIYGRDLVRTFLELPSVVYMGKLSYSLYLWHLPVIYFAHLYVDASLAVVLIPVVSVLCAMVSYHGVENPLRYSTLLDTVFLKSVRLAPAVLMLAVIGVDVVGIGPVRAAVNAGFNTFGESIAHVNYIETRTHLGARIDPEYVPNEEVRRACAEELVLEYGSSPLLSDTQCLKFSGDVDEPLFFLIGDSHALHFVPMLFSAETAHNLIFSQLPANAIVAHYAKDFNEAVAEQVVNERLHELKSLKTHFPTVYYVISLYLTPYESQRETIERNLRRYIEAIEPHAQVILIAPTPVFPGGPASCVLLGKHCTIDRATDQKLHAPITELLRTLDASYDRVSIYDPYPVICPDAQCKNYDAAADRIIYLDDDHITPEQSAYMAESFEQWFTSTFGDSH